VTTATKTLILHIEVPGIWADDLPESAAVWSENEEPTAAEYAEVVTEEWMRPEVAIAVVTWPGEKNLTSDFELHTYKGRIVGAAVSDVGAAS
jgi:hypothetical protein